MLEIKKAPEKLYAMGNIELLQNKAIAIVGTRTNTEYGEECTKKFASKLAKIGLTIVSGLAEGIDSIAHKSAMKKEGRTIAVLGSGFNNIFPKENKKLFNEILENDGCVISEYPQNEEKKSSNFPTRNRIIAGLSKGVLVVEAKSRSGSSITARYGFEQAKPVFCIPNKIGVKTGVGTNNLIKIGAHLVTNVNEILLEIGEEAIEGMEDEIIENQTIEDKTIEEIKEEQVEKNSEKQIIVKKEYREIYKTLEKGTIEVNELARNLKQNIIEINQKLTMMEIEGLIETLPGNRIKRKE